MLIDMGLLDTVKDAISGSDETWLDRTRSGILLTSPTGKEFTGDFVSDDASKEKKLQITSYFGVKYSKVKDLEIGSPTYNIPFYFSGPNNDLIGKDFWDTCDENGQWEIIHPIQGRLPLQLVSVKIYNRPVEEGNQTGIDSVWIRPMDDEAPETGKQLQSMADFSINNFNDNSALSFVDKINMASEAFQNGVANTVQQINGIANMVLDPVAALNDFGWKAFHSVIDGINQIKKATILRALSLAGQLQQLLMLPLLSTSDIKSRIKTYIELSQAISSVTTKENGDIKIANNQNGLNTCAIVELTQNTVIAAICKIAITGEIESKTHARKIIEDILDTAEYIDEQLDSLQEIYKDNTVDKTFIPGNTDRQYRDQMIYTVIRYIIITVIQKRPEKIKVINKFIPSIVFCINEYGTIDDNIYQSFIEKNNLTDLEIMMLPPNKEVVI